VTTLDYLIIGGGITGVSLARSLQMKGISGFLVLEASPDPGGLCRSISTGGHVLDLGGGHFLCSRHKEVYDFIFSHIPQSEFQEFSRVSKIQLADGSITDYPLESNLWQLPIEKQIDFLLSATSAGEVSSASEPTNYEEWIRWKLGERVATDYLLPYNRKIWGVEPADMDIDWLHKIPRINLRDALRSSLNRSSDRSRMPSHETFLYPRQGGYQAIFDAILAPVHSQVLTGQPVTSLRREDGQWIVNGEFRCRHLINTAPWQRIAPCLAPAEAEALAPFLPRLRSNSIVVSLLHQPFDHDWHWCYLPDPALPHHREFYIRNFAPHSAPGGVYTETNRLRWHPNLEALHEHINEDAYPVPTVGHTAAITGLLDTCRPWNLHGLGRWGQHSYFNADVCIHHAIRLAADLAD
jgi:protoporphyrinogen oxidase